LQEQIILAVIGAVMPPFIDLINRFVKNSRLRFVVSIMSTLLVGGILALAQYGSDIWTNTGLIFAASQTVYKLWYSESEIKNFIRG